MARYIDADMLLIDLHQQHTIKLFKPTKEDVQFVGMLETINKQPTADVEEVKHGEWKSGNDLYYRVNCSLCGYEHYLGAFYQYSGNYCPNCGAKMDGGKKG